MMLPGETLLSSVAGMTALSRAANCPPSGLLIITSSSTSRKSCRATPAIRMPTTTPRDLTTDGFGVKRTNAAPRKIKPESESNSASDMRQGSTEAPATEPNFYAVQMSTQAEVVSAIAVSHPRRAVIDRAWRAIGPGVEVLSGDDGGPLRRTVKRIIDPLVLRLRSNTHYSAPFVNADVAAAIHEEIVGQSAQLRAAAAWFEILKRERRRLRITTGNAQELYFPLCFELAVTKGPPTQHDHVRAEAVLREIHGDRDRTAIEVLNQHVSDPQVIAKPSDQLDRSWRDVRAGTEIIGPFMAGLTTVLGPSDGHRSKVARQRVWSALIADATPYNL